MSLGRSGSLLPMGPTASSHRTDGRPKLLHITTSDSSLDLLLLPQLRAFEKAGYEVVGASAPGSHVATLQEAGIRHIPLDRSTRSMDPLSDVLYFAELVKMMRRERPTIVHTHNPKPGWFGGVAARLGKVPVVVNTVHGLYATARDPLPRRGAVYVLERVASMFADIELVQNPEDVTAMRRLRIPASKLHLLGNGIDLDRFGPIEPDERAKARERLGLTDDQVVIGAVSRLVWEKGLRELFGAAVELRESVPEAQILVAGPFDSSKSDGLTPRQVARIAEETGVRFLGEHRRIEEVYAALDIYVLASHREGFPRSAMEAAALGLPTVATNIRGCRQVVDPDSTGLLVAPGDAISLAGALRRLALDPDLRAAMGAAAIAKAHREFDQTSVIDVTLEAYRRLLAAKGISGYSVGRGSQVPRSL